MKTKLRLTNAEQQEYNANIERLIAIQVIPAEERPLLEARTLTVEQIAGPTESFVHASSVGGYGIAVWVRIVLLKSGVDVSDCQITPRSWDDPGISLVDLPERIPYYTVRGGVEFPKDDVLNHWISSGLYLERGRVLQGVLIAQSFEPLPAKCSAGIEVEANLSFLDQFGNQYPLSVDLMVVRDNENIERPAYHTGLYAGSSSRERVRNLWPETPDLGSRLSVSPEESNMPRGNRALRFTDVSRGMSSKRTS